jgi:hypothetical protein
VAAPALLSTPQMAVARARRGGSGNTEPSSASAAGAASAAPAPWANRAASKAWSPGVRPTTAEANPKTAMPVRNTRRWPSRSASRPPSSSRPPNDRP